MRRLILPIGATERRRLLAAGPTGWTCRVICVTTNVTSPCKARQFPGTADTLLCSCLTDGGVLFRPAPSVPCVTALCPTLSDQVTGLLACEDYLLLVVVV